MCARGVANASASNLPAATLSVSELFDGVPSKLFEAFPVSVSAGV
jgi:hypothetical protein